MNNPIAFTRQGQIGTVTLSNPGKLNALSVSHWNGLRDIMRSIALEAAQGSTLRAIVLRGAEGNFAAGADISEFHTVRANSADGTQYHEETVKGALTAIAECPVPTVALIEGACVGGGLEIACSCDLRIAGESSRFGVPINRLGFPLAHSEMAGLLALVGKAVTLEILLEGRVFGAREAYEKGLLTRIVPDAEVEKDAYAAAERIAAGGPNAARANKRWVRRLSVAPAPLTADEVRDHFSFFDTDEYREGVRSFLAKTKPNFN